METSSGRPYQEYELMNGDKLRAFDDQSNPLEFIWHRDQEDREVYVEEEGSGWMFQYDNELPVELNKGDKLFVPKMTFHRLIQGKEKLIVRIHTV